MKNCCGAVEHKKRQAVMVWLSTLIMGYMAMLFVLYIMQRSMIYYPETSTPLKPAAYGLKNAETVFYHTDDGLELLGWFIAPPDPTSPIVVFFHGNAGHIGSRADKARIYTELGYGVFMPEYRGYGGNPGSPSEEGLYKDARAALKWLMARGGQEGRIVLYGESLGSGVACQMAVEFDVAALLLEAPFDSLTSLAQSKIVYAPVRWLLKDEYRNIDKITRFQGPVLIAHGQQDTVIPRKFASNLYRVSNQPKKFLDIKTAGHNDIFTLNLAKAQDTFLKKHGVK